MTQLIYFTHEKELGLKTNIAYNFTQMPADLKIDDIVTLGTVINGNTSIIKYNVTYICMQKTGEH